MNRIRLSLAIAVAGLTLASATCAQDLEREARALKLMTETANSICQNKSTGRSTSVQVQGGAKAEVSKLVKQLADLGVSGAITWTETSYDNVLQKDLASALERSTQCAERIFNSLRSHLLPAPIPGGNRYKPAATLTQDGLKVAVEECRFTSGGFVACTFFITSLNGTIDFGVQFGGCCTAIDQRGNSTILAHAAIGNVESRMTRHTGYAKSRLVQDVPTRVVLTFGSFPSGAIGISEMQIRFKAASNLKHIVVREIEIQA